jgi:hypothetical protein
MRSSFTLPNDIGTVMSSISTVPIISMKDCSLHKTQKHSLDPAQSGSSLHWVHPFAYPNLLGIKGYVDVKSRKCFKEYYAAVTSSTSNQ